MGIIMYVYFGIYYSLHDNRHIQFALLPNSTQYFIDDDTFEPQD